MNYPKTMSEWDTMQAAVDGRSLARIGDGEQRLALGVTGKHIAQTPHPRLTEELQVILKGKSTALVCIPNHAAPNGKPVMWGPTRYGGAEYTALYNYKYEYGSSFICRPDSAPWIDCDDYWMLCRKLWYDKHVIMVIGTRGGSLTHLVHARSVDHVWGPENSAYAEVDRLEGEVMEKWNDGGRPNRTVLICLGPAATILAHRLSGYGVHACDLGHLGRFMPQKFLQPRGVVNAVA